MNEMPLRFTFCFAIKERVSFSFVILSENKKIVIQTTISIVQFSSASLSDNRDRNSSQTINCQKGIRDQTPKNQHKPNTYRTHLLILSTLLQTKHTSFSEHSRVRLIINAYKKARYRTIFVDSHSLHFASQHSKR